MAGPDCVTMERIMVPTASTAPATTVRFVSDLDAVNGDAVCGLKIFGVAGDSQGVEGTAEVALLDAVLEKVVHPVVGNGGGKNKIDTRRAAYPNIVVV